jgi:hypothetical protein
MSNRHLETLVAYSPQNVKAVRAPKHQVEDDELGRMLANLRQRGYAVAATSTV